MPTNTHRMVSTTTQSQEPANPTLGVVSQRITVSVRRGGIIFNELDVELTVFMDREMDRNRTKHIYVNK